MKRKSHEARLQSKVKSKHIALCVLGAAMCIFMGLVWRSEYRQYGYYYDAKYHMVIRGPGALLTIDGLLAGGFVFGGYALYLTIVALRQRKLEPPGPPKAQPGAEESERAPIKKPLSSKTGFD